MKAIKFCEYGPPDVLKVEEIEKPVPRDNELLVRVRAASLNFIDAGLVRIAVRRVARVVGRTAGRRGAARAPAAR